MDTPAANKSHESVYIKKCTSQQDSGISHEKKKMGYLHIS
jgi:hypothetical protein